MTTLKPSRSEEEYFAREEAEKKRKLALKQTKTMAQEELDALRALHAMHCPKCGLMLHEIQLEGVAVDRCFHCQGIFINEEGLQQLAQKEGHWSRILRFFSRKDYSEEITNA